MPRRRYALLLLLPWVLGAGKAEDDLWQREFRCEEAAAHAASCCPDLRVDQLYCSYEARGCGFDSEGCAPDPVLSVDDATCVRDMPCEQLRASGVCAALRALEGKTSCEKDVPRETSVCP